MRLQVPSGHMTKRKWDVVDFLMIAALVGIVLVVIWFVTGCKSMSKVEDTEFLWSDGKGCVLYAKNIEAMKAQESSKNFKFKDCEIIFNDEANEGAKK